METPPEELKQDLREMYSKIRLMFLQTEEMKSSFLRMLKATEDKIAILPPMVQDFPPGMPSFKNNNNVLVYVGKFSNDYYLYESLMALRKIADQQYTFNVAGDKFHLDLKVPKEELIALMESIPGVNWLKGMNREDAGKLVEDSDLGLCWRSEVIDNERSMELSTKLLEYGRLGKPVLVRRIPIHERLLGADYPFYVNTEDDLVQKIKLAFTNPELYEKAARKVYEVSLGHSFSHVARQIMPYLDRFKMQGKPEPGEKETEVPAWKRFFKDLSRKLNK
ncbi:MAG: glycosyltransferase family 4 protein [Bacteroidales bacterium]|nr:glycosyltransferase family 4 protein [Bacteroidales bacterium]